jgi:20S proteasome alpha/beta subunit
MTQALAGFNEHGIVLATDSRATRFDVSGEPETFNVNKLFALSRRCGILSGGAGVSVSLSLALRRQIARHAGPLELEEMAEYALPFLSRGYQRHLETHGPEAEGFRRLYFILAGYVPDAPPPHFQMVLLGSEDNELPLRRIQIGNVVVMPRNLGMEMRLFKALNQGADLEEILHLAKDFLEKMAAVKEEVGPPFHYATITSRGYQTIIL